MNNKGLLAAVAEYVLVYWVDPLKETCSVGIIVKYYLTNSNKYGIIVVLRRKNTLSYS